jgi:hypothetical protein
MRNIKILLLVTLGCFGTARAADKYGLAADNKIFAQTLVNQIMAENPNLVSVGIHCVPPGGDAQSIVASTLNVIGKKSDPEDILHGSTVISPHPRLPKLGIMLPLHDRDGHDLGSLALSFKFQSGEDQVKFFAQATVIRDRIAPEIASLAALCAAP